MESVRDEVLGELRHDKECRWYEGEIKHGGVSVRICLVEDDAGITESLVSNARGIVESLDRISKEAKDLAVAELLDLKNSNWLDENEEEVSERQFRKRVKLATIVVYPSGDADFYHHDGDLFWGHSIMARRARTGRFSGADLVG